MSDRCALGRWSRLCIYYKIVHGVHTIRTEKYKKYEIECIYNALQVKIFFVLHFLLWASGNIISDVLS